MKAFAKSPGGESFRAQAEMSEETAGFSEHPRGLALGMTPSGVVRQLAES
jgi:hypothetical protein